MILPCKLRLAIPSDANDLLSIYAPYILDTAITFETEIPSITEFQSRITNIQTRFPWLVCEIDSKVVGYGYASPHRTRAAYQWSADLSIYVDPVWQRHHIATAIYQALIEILKRQGYYTAFAGVTVPNEKSETFHQSLGFTEIGTFPNAGWKLGAWHGVKWYALALADYDAEPVPPKPFGQAIDTQTFETILHDAKQRVL